MTYILAIESSCDETAAAVIKKTATSAKIISSVVASQIAIHQKYGGVVPEVAARAHATNIIPVIDEALLKAKINLKKIDKLAVTVGPGLLTSLLVGLQTAQAISLVLNKPLIGVNHLAGHLLAPLNNKSQKFITAHLPAVALIASGGHTEIILLKKIGQYKKLGTTRDDAAGECFDKIAKLLKLPYPGGPQIAKRAALGRDVITDVPRPMLNRLGYEFSFSGLKTWALYYVRDHGLPRGQKLNDFCASIEQAIVDVLVGKTLKAAEQYKVKSIIVGGGVAANGRLRRQLTSQAKIPVLISPLELCGDNAAMIGLVAALDGRSEKLVADPNLSL